jgi:hypothetical protein
LPAIQNLNSACGVRVSKSCFKYRREGLFIRDDADCVGVSRDEDPEIRLFHEDFSLPSKASAVRPALPLLHFMFRET